MSVQVSVYKADVYYRPAGAGTKSGTHDLFTIAPGAQHAATGATAAFHLSQTHNIHGSAAAWLLLTDDAFAKFKNGGKRLPSGVHAGFTHKSVGAVDRDRPDREKTIVREGDVGPYKKGDGHLYKANLALATSVRPASWTAGNPPEYQTDPKAHVQQRQNRDHQNNQAALEERGDDPKEGIAITLPQWVHMNGYTFGNKAKPGKLKNPAKATAPNQSRTQWIAANPSPALFKEIYHSIRLYQKSNQLTYEIVGSFRYLYKLSVSEQGYTATVDLDRLIMHYLGIAK
jgi:hypothetical protein